MALWALACAGATAQPQTEPSSRESQSEQASPTPDATSSSAGGSESERLQVALPPFAKLDVAGFLPAHVALPEDVSVPRPVVVAAHGAGDGPRYQCEFWRELLEARAFVLCPTGTPLGKSEEHGHYYKNHHELEREVLAAVDALRAEYGSHLAPGPFVYVAYSQGATMGALMLPAHGDLFSRLVLVEGGFQQWTVSAAKKLRASGAERVLLVCGTRSCHRGAERSLEWLKKAGLEARVEMVPGGGHTYGGAVAERLQQSLAWVFEGDERFR